MKRSLRVVLLAATVFTPSLAMAQDAPAEEGGIKDIVVTARKTSETLSDAPVAVSVVTSEKINELGLNSIDDFAKQSTGISFSQAFGRTTDRPVIRGQSNVLAGVQAGVETGAAYFVDGVYYQGDIQGFDPQSIERVEVIKGPQSALYGRNTYAGAINYITKDPSKDLTISGRARAAEHDEYEIAGSVSGQLIPDVFGFRAGGRFYKYGGEYTNQLTGKKVGNEKTTSAYLTLQLEPSSDIKWRTRVNWQHDEDGPLAIFLQGAAANNCKPGYRSPRYRTASPFVPLAPAVLASTNTNQFFCGTIQPQPNNVRLNTDPLLINPVLGTRDGTAFDGIENKQVLVTSVLDWNLGGSGWMIHALGGWRKNYNYFGTDSDHSDAFAYFAGTAASTLNTEPAFANTNRDVQKDVSAELRLSTPEDKPIRAMIGGFYYKQNFETTDITFASGKGALALGTDGSQYATVENKAIFGLVEWDITDALSVTAELRHAKETKTLIDRATAASIFCAGESGRAATFGFAGTCRGAGSFSGTDPRITVNYTTPGGTLIYAVFATGRKPGGFNGTAGVTAETQYPGTQFVNYLPEKSKGGELGVKFDALDRRLRVNVTGFYNELTDYQLTTSIPNPAGTGAVTSIVSNAGKAQTKGLELEITAAPADNLLINLGLSYVDAKFTEGCDADEFILNSGGLRPNFDTRNPTAAGKALCDISGRKLPLGSPIIVNGSVSWSKELNSNGLEFFANSNFSYEDAKYIQVDNLAKTGDAFLLNARLGIKTANFSIAVFGRNLTDEDSIPLATRWFDLRYGAGTTGLPPAASVSFDGRPAQIETGTPRAFFATLRRGRTFGVEASVNF
ncbi:TonB-dependent receptor [Novosphingobium ginsenosidimutans]|uniref:TonB-dependent receptor n=1 Tax=Novosphingobium ginsenosidimutans TaxID=1176536 RepID=A0A5B8S5C8_9SPHN|nr:TonB-dependent receptor [Novosphingobium ginsenosidimutans]QEA16593.1 TonB-dependent receptor [Novosphingobium ginsenosidimutans]